MLNVTQCGISLLYASVNQNLRIWCIRAMQIQPFCVSRHIWQCVQERDQPVLAAMPAMPAAATPSKSAASAKEASGSVSKRKKAADRSPVAEPSVTNVPDATSLQEPAKRAARASAVSAMASWKQSRIFTDEEDSFGSDDEGRTVRRGKRVCCRLSPVATAQISAHTLAVLNIVPPEPENGGSMKERLPSICWELCIVS
jgi:hypothetical protein